MKTMALMVAAVTVASGLGASGLVGSALAAVVATPSGIMSLQSGSAGDGDGAFVSLTKFSEPTGEKIFLRVCAGCHMPDARGAREGAGFYPALAGDKNLAASGYPLYIVLHGKHGMPALGRMMTDDQVAQVVNYVRSNFGNKYRDKVSAADARAIR